MPKQKPKPHEQPERVWRWLVNFWMMILMVAVIADFFMRSRYEFIMLPLGMIYVSLLSVYVSTKEFERWFLIYKRHHPGEIGVMLWTILIISLVVLNAVLGDGYKISPDVVWTYVTVISVFVASRASKLFFTRRHKNHR
jgi:hypothetical protein